MINRRKDLDEYVNVPEVNNRMTQAGTRVVKRYMEAWSTRVPAAREKSNQGQQNYLRFGFPSF